MTGSSISEHSALLDERIDRALEQVERTRDATNILQIILGDMRGEVRALRESSESEPDVYMERDALLAERDALLTERDALLAELAHVEAFVVNESSRIDDLDGQKGSVKQDREMDSTRGASTSVKRAQKNLDMHPAKKAKLAEQNKMPHNRPRNDAGSLSASGTPPLTSRADGRSSRFNGPQQAGLRAVSMSLTGSVEWPPKRERAFSVADHGYANRTSFANNDPVSRGTGEEAHNGLSQDFSDKKPPELSPLWLTDPSLGDRRGCVVRINGTRGAWWDGEKEGIQGVIEGIQDARSAQMPSTATVRLDQPAKSSSKYQVKDELQVLTVPVQYLVPVPPTKPASAMMLMGKWRGTAVAAVQRAEGASPGEDGEKWVVTRDGKQFENILIVMLVTVRRV
ncbi:hypothetical protein HETIRDRAFT_423289 [Heterobasidion irregulare TC 32-1]|uniref:Uncharacterized protein n=1 Tax=Heterobasidion irregulare (strain TC 32-1) TaxID=747525 RepID=W4JM27_HETIT|nr:uncharacterized protein HETIRDRAFT_423289 [Heterobasidion irregulare TC 32-1]ETW74607.1 hypothetical protein HETIRDRAFT_423289 [Heterobasidion irregulare TC 32-1]